MSTATAQRRLVRLLRLSEHLARNERGTTIRRLVERLGTSRATLYRDLEILESAGLPIHRDTRGGEVFLTLDPEVRRPPLPASATGARLAVAVLAPLRGSALYEDLLALAAGTRRVERVSIPGAPAAREPLVRSLDAAIAQRRRVRIGYRDGSGKASIRDVEPAVFRLVGNQLYVVAWDVAKHAWRTFKVARVTSVGVIGEPQTQRPAFDDAALFAHAVRTWSGPSIEVRLRLSERASRLAGEYPLRPDQRLQPINGGGALLEATCAGLIEPMRWVLAWGSDVEVLQPDALREAVRSELEAAVALYRRGSARLFQKS